MNALNRLTLLLQSSWGAWKDLFQDKPSVDTGSIPHASILPSSYKGCWAKADGRGTSEDNIILFEVGPPCSRAGTPSACELQDPKSR